MVVVVNFQDFPLSVGVEEAFLVAEGRVQRRNLVLSFLPGNPDPLIPRSMYSGPCLRACVSTWYPLLGMKISADLQVSCFPNLIVNYKLSEITKRCAHFISVNHAPPYSADS